jgi:hypothetical protein
LVLALAGLGSLPSQVRAAEQGQGAVDRHAPGRHARRSGLEDRVAMLTKALDLDPIQQGALRKVLQRQREQVLRIWSDGSMPSAERIASTTAASKQTAKQIRALLNEEQRKKYDPPPPGDPGRAVGNAHVEDWMKGGTIR